MLAYIAWLRKFLAAAAGAIAVAASLELIDGTAMKWTTGIIAVVTAFLVLLVPNADKPEVPDAT